MNQVYAAHINNIYGVISLGLDIDSGGQQIQPWLLDAARITRVHYGSWPTLLDISFLFSPQEIDRLIRLHGGDI